MKVSIRTLGCKVNQYESQAMLDMLLQAGFSQAEPGEAADVAIVNSCTVTASSDAKVRQMFRRVKRENPDAVMVLTGCMPQAFPEAVAGQFPDADVILGTKNRAALKVHIFNYLSTRQQIVDISPHGQHEAFESMTVSAFSERTRAFVKIEDGCNRFCSFCIIPYARGRVRSKPLSDIRQEVKQLCLNGFSEIVLTGINLPAYGQDIGAALCDAVEAVCDISGVQRVRLGSLEPERLTDSVIARLAAQKKLCPQFHLSLQSGCDETLRRMNRHYTTADYREIVQRLRGAFENAAITTDLMVGFPGETAEEFTASLAFAQEIQFARTHVFAYSRRPGTKAYDAPDQVANREKEARSHQMLAVAKASQQAFFKAQTGRLEAVLFEQPVAESEATAETLYEGYTMNYTPVRAAFKKNPQGKILNVRIIGAEADFCSGVAESI